MKFTNKIAVLVGLAIACALPMKAQNLDLFNSIRVMQFSTNNTIAANALFTTNGPYDMAGFVGRGIMLANAYTNGSGPGTIAFKLETSSDSTNWLPVSNFATITSYTLSNYTNLDVIYNQSIFNSMNFIVTNIYMLPYVTTSPSAPYAGYNTPYNAPNLFTNVAGYTTIPNNGQDIVWSVNANDQQRYWHIVWQATGIATNGLFPTNSFVSATWFGNRINAP